MLASVVRENKNDLKIQWCQLLNFQSLKYGTEAHQQDKLYNPKDVAELTSFYTWGWKKQGLSVRTYPVIED